MKHRFESKPELEVVGYTFRTTTAEGQSMREVPPFWGRCTAEGKIDLLNAVASPFGLFGLCAEFDDKMEAFTYVIGVELKPGAKAPNGTKRVKISAAHYAVFSCVGAMPLGIQNGWHEIMGSWLPTSTYAQASPVNFELYPYFPAGDERGDPTSPNCYTEIWIPVEKKGN